MDWNLLRAFHATATLGSLSAAARHLSLTQPTLSRQIIALEAELGVELFERIGRRLSLSPTGSALLEHIERMGDAADAFSLAASGNVQALTGRVSISATDTFSAYVLPEILDRIRLEAPQLSVMVVASNDLSDLHRREADIAIRHVAPDRERLVGQRLRDTEAHFYASHDWVERNGLPRSVDELAHSDLIGIEDVERYTAYLNGMGIPIGVSDFRLLSNSGIAVWQMVRQGLGVAAMLREVAERTPEVTRLPLDLPGITVPIWLITHQGLEASPRIRLVQRIVSEELARM
ncbi:LysR family transcriptional regulator [Nitratireductor sp. L1-7-SE]|uniref:LysR family transcriptional regulator n=1 Tax=Nitratireductor rhodophyticola TaxID=2854036 RepID=A0ABS7R5I5_9HYPH|nr:LysR family transcriptional regulator [Nitratireductor rhodophyticola]MBY8919655.1 LysR family transcriptional regulator [Nitratireductor rhodophyticola]